MNALPHRHPLWIFAAIALLGLIAGCACKQQTNGQAPPTSHANGKSPRDADHHFASRSWLENGETRFESTVMIDQARTMHIQHHELVDQEVGQTLPDFEVYYEPQTRPNEFLPFTVRYTQPAVVISGGWALLVGQAPMGQTTRVRAMGIGTKIIIQIDGNMHRVYVHAGSARIFTPPEAQSSTHPNLTAGNYGEIGPDNVWRPRGPYADTKHQAFVDRALLLAEAAGVR